MVNITTPRNDNNFPERSQEKVSMTLYRASPIATPFAGVFEFIFEHIFIVGPNKSSLCEVADLAPPQKAERTSSLPTVSASDDCNFSVKSFCN